MDMIQKRASDLDDVRILISTSRMGIQVYRGTVIVQYNDTHGIM